jgi:hypothetical protein
MRHLTGYNESAGRPWWRVDEEGLRRHMSGQVVDCFSGGEVKAILGLVGDVVPRDNVPGGNLALVDLYSIDGIRRNPVPSTSAMSIDLFGLVSDRIGAYMFCDGEIDFTHSFPIHSRSSKFQLFDYSFHAPPDRIKISAGTSDYSDRVVCLVVKSVDDYFYVQKYHSSSSETASDHYICDAIAGLMSLLPLVLSGREDI